MAEARTRQRNVQQHFVTAAYLVGFTPDGTRDSKLYVYARNSERMFRLIPDEAAKRRNYYSVPQKGGGFNDAVDDMLTALEGQGMPSLQKILNGDYNLTIEERALLAYLIAFQEFRTPWVRSMFQQMEITLMEHLMEFAAKTPGYFEHAVEQLQAEGKTDTSVTAEQLRESVINRDTTLEPLPHMGIDTMVSLSQGIGDVYTQMRWTILQASENEFVTSDAPVVRRDPAPGHGFYGNGGLMSPTAEVWFPLSKKICLRIDHDAERRKAFSELLRTGKAEEAEALRANLPPIQSMGIARTFVQAINGQTILTADRFVYSPFESKEIQKLFKGESRNFRVGVSYPFSQKSPDMK